MKVLKGIGKGIVSLMLVGVGMFSGQVWAAPITVANFSFEAPPSNNGGTACVLVPGWSCVPNDVQQGVYVPNSTQYDNNGTNGLPVGNTVPDGTQAAYSNASGGVIRQNTAALITANTTYTLDVFVGDRKDTAFPGGSLQLTHSATAGGVGVAFATLVITNPGNGVWLNEELVAPIGAVSPFLGEFLGIALINGGAGGGVQINFDNVRLDAAGPQGAVPEPTTLLLLGSGLLGLSLIRRRKAA